MSHRSLGQRRHRPVRRPLHRNARIPALVKLRYVPSLIKRAIGTHGCWISSHIAQVVLGAAVNRGARQGVTIVVAIGDAVIQDEVRRLGRDRCTAYPPT